MGSSSNDSYDSNRTEHKAQEGTADADADDADDDDDDDARLIAVHRKHWVPVELAVRGTLIDGADASKGHTMHLDILLADFLKACQGGSNGRTESGKGESPLAPKAGSAATSKKARDGSSSSSSGGGGGGGGGGGTWDMANGSLLQPLPEVTERDSGRTKEVDGTGSSSSSSSSLHASAVPHEAAQGSKPKATPSATEFFFPVYHSVRVEMERVLKEEAGITFPGPSPGIPPAATAIAEHFLHRLHAYAEGQWKLKAWTALAAAESTNHKDVQPAAQAHNVQVEVTTNKYATTMRPT